MITTETLRTIFEQVAQAVDGARLVKEGLAADATVLGPHPVHVLAVGKVAFPMFAGVADALAPGQLRRGLLIAPQTRFPAHPQLPVGVSALAADHPQPTARSVAAGRAALAFVGQLTPGDRLLVLLSGGGSSIMAVPAGTLTLEDKRATVSAVARGGAPITQLNTVRKHLSAVKGGALALATSAPTSVLALSDVVGNDPGTIASGPFSADPTTFPQARDLIRALAPQAPAAAAEWIEQGCAGQHPETPKPGDGRLAHVTYRLMAGPESVPAHARRLGLAQGLKVGLLSENTERDVNDLAQAYRERAHHEAAARGDSRLLVGNGEPAIVVSGTGRGGRATHLALLMARELAGLAGVFFLAAGTDDRDGSCDAAGAVVDGGTWAEAEAAGLDPAGALQRCDSATPLEALGCLVRGPGSSNLLDLHLLGVSAR